MQNPDPMTVAQLLARIRRAPERVEFDEVMGTINAYYHYTPVRFTNGPPGDRVVNEAGSNEGSCKLFAFARINRLDASQTLACFGRYYREDVLLNPQGTDHTNIRTFIRHGWDHLRHDAPALTLQTNAETTPGINHTT